MLCFSMIVVILVSPDDDDDDDGDSFLFQSREDKAERASHTFW